MALSEKQIHDIETSWAVVKKDLQGAGLIMFFKLFEIAPHLKALFPFKDEALSEENESLRKHALQVMQTVDTAVTLLLSGDLKSLQESLVELGVIHNFNNVKPEHFAPVGESLVYALSQALGEEFTEEVKGAWLGLYGFVETTMEKGMKEGMDVF